MKKCLIAVYAMLLCFAVAPLSAQEEAPKDAAAPAAAPAAAEAEEERLPPPDPTKEIPADQLKTIEVKNPQGTVTRRFQVYTDEHGREIKHGLYQEWYDNGTPSREMTYRHGQPDGNQKWWHSNGVLWMEFKTKMGVRDGTYQEYYRTGKIKNRWVYRDGQVVSRK